MVWADNGRVLLSAFFRGVWVEKVSRKQRLDDGLSTEGGGK